MTSETSCSKIRMMAIRLLAMREHSFKELEGKLNKKFATPENVLDVICNLRDEAWQSDSRFAEAFTRMRLRQGKGAIRILRELQERGVEQDTIDRCLFEYSGSDPDKCNELAFKAHFKKFGDQPLVDIKDKARRIRFLSARGFSAANISFVLAQLP